MSQLILCHTPTRGWVNLFYARQVHFRKAHLNNKEQIACVIVWSNGDKQVFWGPDAQAINQKYIKISKET